MARLSGTGREDRGDFGKLASLCRLLDEHGDAVEADLLRFYRVDLLDFYRGSLSVRRLSLLIKHLPIESATTRAVCDGHPPLSRTELFLADLWTLWAKEEHPIKAEVEAKERNAKKTARMLKKQQTFEKRKRTYGLG